MNIVDTIRRYTAPMDWRRVRVTVVHEPTWEQWVARALLRGRCGAYGYGATRRAALTDALQGARIRSAAGNGDTILRAIDRGAIRREMRAAWYGPPRDASDDPGDAEATP